MSTIYQSLVKGMHQKFGISYEDLPNFTEEERIFRIAAMQEELDEYEASSSSCIAAIRKMRSSSVKFGRSS